MPVRRISDRATFHTLRHHGLRARRGMMSVAFVPAAVGDDRCRVAYAVSKRAGSAVDRNRVRRRLRAAMAEIAPPPGAYLLTAGAEALTSPFEGLRADLGVAIEAVVHRAAVPAGRD